ncbi:phage portal protein [Paenibacillus cisolokensis]|uniref:phage portal protein n=1 Tax=Paenibacillus cisolokensis TaxID=1658519 RepID=UPI003D266C01
MNTLQEILENIKENAPMTLEEIIRTELAAWEASRERKTMLEGKKYYLNKNKILERKRTTIDENGDEIEVRNLANNRIPHGFYRKLVDQKVGYLLSRPFMVETEKEAYQKLLDGYFDKGFRRMLKNLGKEAIKCGRAWLQVYYNENGNLAFKPIPSEEGIPLWKDAAHTELDAFIRTYTVEAYEARTKKEIKRVEFWSLDGVRIYEGDNGGLKLIDEHAHFSVAGKDGEIPMNWERVPFICFKYNEEEQPLIEMIKELVDDYDKRISDNSNNLEDLPNGIYVVKNYQGTGGEDFRKNISTFRVVFVDEDGGVDTITLDLSIEAHKNHIEQLRRDIYEFGRGVDTQSDKFGNSPSGIALRFLYSDLDMDANDLESEFQAGLEQLLWFIDTHLANTHQGDFSEEPVEFIFNRDILINETEAVTNAKDSVGIISDETIVANHPWTTNTKEELQRIKKEQEDDQKRFDQGQFEGLENEEDETP